MHYNLRSELIITNDDKRFDLFAIEQFYRFQFTRQYGVTDKIWSK